MLNNSNTFFFVALLCLLGCNSADKGDSNQADFKYKIMVENVEENVSFDDIVQDYKYVKLETGSSSLLGEIKKIIVVDEKIYVLSQGLFCFDINGKFLFAINKMGRGPSEFIRINDFAIDGDKLFLYDNILSKLICFNKETGTYLKDWKLIYSVKELQVINGRLILNRGNTPTSGV